MTPGIVDTTVILHYFRNYQPARNWVDANSQALSVTTITWLEVMMGASNKANQAESRRILSKFQLIYLTASDQQWAMQRLDEFQFSHHIGMNDCLIAAVAHRRQLSLYTHNLKDMQPMISELAVKPYP
jgi:predicted nucleic acid-binding protein